MLSKDRSGSDLSKTFMLFKFDKNWYGMVMVFCATWHSWE